MEEHMNFYEVLIHMLLLGPIHVKNHPSFEWSIFQMPFLLLGLILPHRIIIYAGSNSMTWRIKSVSFCRFAQKAVLQNAMECPPPLAVHSNLIIQTTS